MTNELFLDTAYAIALSAASDKFHEQALRIAQDLEATKARLVTTSAVLLEIGEEAQRLYRSRPDKEWGLTDCVSFVVMQERGIIQALTADHHFYQAGFQVLLRDYPPRTSH